MINNIKINGFGEWLIPTGEGVMHLEGVPTKEKRAFNKQCTTQRRKNRKPSLEALTIFDLINKLRTLEFGYFWELERYWTPIQKE